MLLALDTETTGTDAFHGCRPFMISGCDGTYNYVWKGSVDPQTRGVYWNQSELEDFRSVLLSADRVVFHHANFDIRMLESIGIDPSLIWPKLEDTLILSHLLCSGDVHGLKELAIKYLTYYDDDEHRLRNRIVEIRNRVRNTICIAKQGHPHFPGVKAEGTKWWKMDLWLDMDLCQTYAVKDAERTYLLYKCFLEPLRYYNLEDQYRWRMDLLPVLYDMQTEGISIYPNKIRRILRHIDFQLKVLEQLLKQSVGWNGHINLESPTDLTELLFKRMGLPVLKYTDGNAPSTDKDAISQLFDAYPDKHELNLFKAWRVGKKEQENLTSYMNWSVEHTDSLRLHSNLNATGTKWTRQSSSDVNQQNFKKELAFLFGPPRGYYWLYADVVNIELRLWAYDSGCKELIEAFENNQNVHLIIARIIRPHQIERGGGEVMWKATDPIHKQYTKTKNGTFAWLYGGSESKVNTTYGIGDATSIIRDKLPGVGEYFDRLNREMQAHEHKYGYPTIFTMGGYKLEVPKQKPYTVVSGRIQGTAGEIVQNMMIELIKHPTYKDPLNWPRSRPTLWPINEPLPSHHPPENCRLIQQVHDSLTIKIPVHHHSAQTNALLVEEMERVGRKYIPTCPMDYEVIEYHEEAPFRLKLYSYLPETIHDFEVTYSFQDGVGWIATAKYKEEIIEAVGTNQEESRSSLICKIEGTPF